MFINNLNPIAFHVFGIQVNWYSLGVPFGALLFYFISIIRINKFKNQTFQNTDELKAFIIYSLIGITLGSRLFYSLFYHFNDFIHNPLFVFQFRQGGESFHGCVLGSGVSTYLYCKKYKKSFWRICDFMVPFLPMVHIIIRPLNFINGELWGRYMSNHLPWAVAFPKSGDLLARHPLQLYEFLGEGVFLLIIILLILKFFSNKLKAGELTGYYIISYSIVRFSLEYFRTPDANLMWVQNATNLTIAQIISIITLVVGVFIVLICRRND